MSYTEFMEDPIFNIRNLYRKIFGTPDDKDVIPFHRRKEIKQVILTSKQTVEEIIKGVA